jgi:hypothetical protein
MQSSAGGYSPRFRAPVWLAVLALAALVPALALTLASIELPRLRASLQITTVRAPVTVPVRQMPVKPAIPPRTSRPQPRTPALWSSLEPWVFRLDALALLGLGVALAVRFAARRRATTP